MPMDTAAEDRLGRAGVRRGASRHLRRHRPHAAADRDPVPLRRRARAGRSTSTRRTRSRRCSRARSTSSSTASRSASTPGQLADAARWHAALRDGPGPARRGHAERLHPSRGAAACLTGSGSTGQRVLVAGGAGTIGARARRRLPGRRRDRRGDRRLRRRAGAARRPRRRRAHAADLSDPQSCTRAPSPRVRDELGGLDVFVHCVGHQRPPADRGLRRRRLGPDRRAST